MKGKDN